MSSAYQTVNLPFPTVGKQVSAIPQAVPRVSGAALGLLQSGQCMQNINGCLVCPAFFTTGPYSYSGGQLPYVSAQRVTDLPAFPRSS